MDHSAFVPASILFFAVIVQALWLAVTLDLLKHGWYGAVVTFPCYGLYTLMTSAAARLLAQEAWLRLAGEALQDPFPAFITFG